MKKISLVLAIVAMFSFGWEGNYTAVAQDVKETTMWVSADPQYIIHQAPFARMAGKVWLPIGQDGAKCWFEIRESNGDPMAKTPWEQAIKPDYAQSKDAFNPYHYKTINFEGWKIISKPGIYEFRGVVETTKGDYKGVYASWPPQYLIMVDPKDEKAIWFSERFTCWVGTRFACFVAQIRNWGFDPKDSQLVLSFSYDGITFPDVVMGDLVGEGDPEFSEKRMFVAVPLENFKAAKGKKVTAHLAVKTTKAYDNVGSRGPITLEFVVPDDEEEQPLSER